MFPGDNSRYIHTHTHGTGPHGESSVSNTGKREHKVSATTGVFVGPLWTTTYYRIYILIFPPLLDILPHNGPLKIRMREG